MSPTILLLLSLAGAQLAPTPPPPDAVKCFMGVLSAEPVWVTLPDIDGALLAHTITSRGTTSFFYCGGPNNAVMRTCLILEEGDRVRVCLNGYPTIIGNLRNVTVFR